MTDIWVQNAGMRQTHTHTHNRAVHAIQNARRSNDGDIKGVHEKRKFILRFVRMNVCVCVAFSLWIGFGLFCTCSFNCSNMMQLNSFVITENILFFIMSFVPLHPFQIYHIGRSYNFRPASSRTRLKRINGNADRVGQTKAKMSFKYIYNKWFFLLLPYTQPWSISLDCLLSIFQKKKEKKTHTHTDQSVAIDASFSNGYASENDNKIYTPY